MEFSVVTFNAWKWVIQWHKKTFQDW